MMDFQLKINKIKNSNEYSSEQLFMIESINEESGFLLGGDIVYFINKSGSSDSESIVTNQLSLRTKININTIENYPTFAPGYYDILAYSNDNDGIYLESFVNLCRMYILSLSKISFRDFFYSLLKLFEPNKEASYTNLIGLFGELSLIKRMFNEYNLILMDNWHNTYGSNDKYDFSLKGFNVEVKTSVKDNMIFDIKHKQIFNEKRNFVVVINIDQDNSGQSLSDLFDFFKETKPFSENIDFAIKLESEKNKVSPQDFKLKRFSVVKYSVFDNKSLKTITNIPEWITHVEYSYDFISQDEFGFENLVKEIRK